MTGLTFALFLAFNIAYAARTSYKTIQYSNCDTNAPIRVNTVDVSPMPVGIPGEFELSFDASVTRDIQGPASLELKINKEKLIFSPKIPCLAKVGSCKYDDVCTLLDQMESETASKDMAVQIKSMVKEQLGMTQICPLKAGDYTVSKAKFKVQGVSKLLSMFASGDYKANILVKDQSGTLMCLDVKLSVEDKGKLFPGK